MINQKLPIKPFNIDPLKRGDRLGDIMLLERIGQGGEGEIWSGVDSRRRRIVAVKVIIVLEQASQNLVKVTRQFEQQVHLIASVEHPNVLPLYQFGISGAHYFLVMRYTPLGSLADLLDKGPLTLEEAFFFAGQIALTLEHLHKKGIVHRDLKPSNILLGSDRQIYLADFGLAKRLSNETMALHTGRGTGPYAPYEQHSMAQIVPQTDIYSLGIVIYEMLAGRLPWDGTEDLATQQFHDKAELPDIHEINSNLSPSVTDALRHLTAFDWRHRPGSALEALQLLATATNGDSHRPLVEPNSVDEDVVEAVNAQALWRTLQEWQVDPSYVSLTHLAFLDSAYSKMSGDDLMRDVALRYFLLAGAINHDYHLNYWWQQVTNPQAKLRICEQALLQGDNAMANRALNLLTTLQGTSGIEFSDGLLDHLLDLVVNSTGTAVRGRAFDILEGVAQERESWQPVGFTAKGDVKLAEFALGESASAARAARLVGQVGSESAVSTMLQKREAVAPDRFLNLLAQIQKTAGSLPNLIPFSIRLRLWFKSFKEQLLEDRAALPWTRGLIGLLTALVFSLLMVAGFLAQADTEVRDRLMTPYPVSNIVTIVGVDDESLAVYGRWGLWPRSLHAELIEKLDALGAKVIVIDALFDSTTAEDDQLLAAIQTADNVILSVSGQGGGLEMVPGRLDYTEGVLPKADFSAAAMAVGHVNVLPDPDSSIRQVPTNIAIGDQVYASLAIRSLQTFLGTNTQLTPEPQDGFLATVGREIPIDDYGEMTLYYAGPPARTGISTFQIVSYLDVLQDEADPDLIRDKIVLIGVMATAEDEHTTPVSQGYQMHGVEILANTIEAIWSNKFIIRPGDPTRVAILLLLGVLTGLLCTRFFSGLVLTGGLALLYFLFISWLFDTQGMMLDILPPYLTIAGTFSAVMAYRYAIEIRSRRRMMNIFADHVSPELTQRALSAVQQGRLKLDGQEQTITILVIDLKTRHDYSLAYEPGQIMMIFKEYLDLITETLFAEAGTIVSTTNQRVVAMFNTPLPQKDHEQRAVLTAVKLQKRLNNFSPSLTLTEEGAFIIGRYAMDTGRAVVGYIGASASNGYSVIGDPLQTAVQLVNLAEPDQILITRSIYDNLDAATKNKASPEREMAGEANNEPVFVISG